MSSTDATSSRDDTSDRLDVDPQTAQRALERTLVQGGALLLPAGRLEIGPSLSYGFNEFALPAVFAVDDELQLGLLKTERESLLANLDLRLGLPFESQLELSLPYRWTDQRVQSAVQGQSLGSSDSRGNGFGGLRLGLAKTLFKQRGWRPDLVGRLLWNTGSGSQVDNGVFLGGAVSSLGVSLSTIHRIDPLVLLGSLSYTTYDDDDGFAPGDQLSFSVGTALAVSPSSSLFALLDNQFISETDVDGRNAAGTDLTAMTLRIGGGLMAARNVLLNVSSGIGITEDAPDYSLEFSASIQTGLLQGLLAR